MKEQANKIILRNRVISLLIYLWLHWLSCFAQASSNCSEAGLLSVVVRGLLIAVASLVMEHKL